MRNKLSDKASSKILKFILFFVVLAAASSLDSREPVSRFLAMPHAVLFAAALAYMLATLSALIMRASHKAAAAVLSFLALYLLILYFMDQFQSYVPFLTETNTVRIVCAVSFLLMAWDICTVIREQRGETRQRKGEPKVERFQPNVRDELQQDNEAEELRYTVSVLLESRWGRTPTDKEVTNYAKQVYANRQQDAAER
ncbi:MAG: hypothetical protein LUE14_04335 [Clostridiales bacterium]|nr:hypothetical protein [Clostridiales bacterium]